MKRHQILARSIACLIAITLSGCSGEPSSSDIEKAVRANVDQSNQQAKNFGGKFASDNLLTKVYGVKKVGCAAAQGSSGFNCDVEVDVSAPFVGRSKNVA